MVSEASFGNTSALSPTPSPSVSVVSEGSCGNASSRSMVPSPSESTSTITALSGQTSVAPKSLPSLGVTETVHVSPTEVAVAGNICMSLYAGTTTPFFDQRICEFTSESPSASSNWYENIISSSTGESPPGKSIKFEAEGGWFCAMFSIIVDVVVSHVSPEFWEFPFA